MTEENINKRTERGLQLQVFRSKGVIQADGTKTDEMKHQEVKEKVKTEYYRRVRKILEMKLDGGNIITGINT